MATIQDILGGNLPSGLLSPEQEAMAQQRAQSAGLTNLGFALLQASQGQRGQPKPSLGQIIGQAGPVGMQAYQGSFDDTLKRALQGMQIGEMKRKQAEEERMRKARETFESRIAGATRNVPTTGLTEGSQQATMLAEQISGFAPEDIAGTRQALLSAGATQQVTDQAVADRAVMDYLRVASPVEYAKLVAKEPRALPSSVQEYQYAVGQGYKGTFEDYKKDVAKAGATSINLPSEGERKAGFLANRVKFGLEQMGEVIGKNAPSASPEALPTLVKFLTQSDFLSNKLTSPDRQRIEAAQLDILDAALTLGTGAAYTKEQIEGYRKSYFPQLGDDQKTVADKQKRLQNLLESAYISAGRSAPTGAVPSIVQPPAPAPQFNKSDVDLINKYLPPKK